MNDFSVVPTDTSELSLNILPPVYIGDSGVTAGSYTNTNLTINSQGIITEAESGSALPISGSGYGSMLVVDPTDTTNVYYSDIVSVDSTGNLITGNIIPSLNNEYTFGSLDKRWKDMYVGPGTINVSGIIYTQYGFVTPFINVGSEIDPNVAVGSLGGWNISVLGSDGSEGLVAQLINPDGSGLTGNVYSLLSAGADPTAYVGSKPIYGNATTYMLSDSAPALGNTAVTAGSYT